MRLALIVNPRAGGGRPMQALGRVTRELDRLGLEHRVILTTGLDHAARLARAAAAAGEPAVAFGGDGLIGAVAGALAGTDGVLGLLPGGRGNDLARSLGVPLAPVAACSVLAGGAPGTVDLGEVEGHPFVGVASCGFDSVANRIANATRLVRGNLVYAYAALRALPGWRPATFTVEPEAGPCRVLTGYSIAAANAGAYGGGMRIAPEASLHDGRLDLVTVADMPKLRFLRLLPSVYHGGHVRRPEVEVVRCVSAQITASRPFTVYADGDPVAELPVAVRALPGAVRVMLPAAGAPLPR